MDFLNLALGQVQQMAQQQGGQQGGGEEQQPQQRQQAVSSQQPSSNNEHDGDSVKLPQQLLEIIDKYVDSEPFSFIR